MRCLNLSGMVLVFVFWANLLAAESGVTSVSKETVILEKYGTPSIALYQAELKKPMPSTVVAQDLKSIVLAIGGQHPSQLASNVPVWIAWSPQTKKPAIKETSPSDLESMDWLQKTLSLREEEWVVVWNATHPVAVAKRTPLSASDRTFFEAIRDEFVKRVALLRGLATLAANPAMGSSRFAVVGSILDFAFEQDGVFRDECGRVIRSIGISAVPGLIGVARARLEKKKEGALFLVAQAKRSYAEVQLGRMGSKTANNALGLARMPEEKEKILKAYGDVQDLQAVGSVVESTMDDSALVRQAARWACAQYGYEGATPPSAPKRERKKTKGQKGDKPQFDYLNARARLVFEAAKKLLDAQQTTPKQFAQWTFFNAVWSRDEENKIVKGRAKDVLQRLFAYQDQQQNRPYEAAFQRGMAAVQAGNLGQAVEQFDWILTNQADPPPSSTESMARVYAQWATTGPGVSPKIRRRAFQKAVLLSPQNPNVAEWKKQINELYNP